MKDTVPESWPDLAGVASRFAGSIDKQADAMAFVRSSCSQSVALIREAFIAGQVFKVWEAEGLNEREWFAKHFQRGKTTLYRWKRSAGLVDLDRSRAIAAGVTNSRSSLCPTVGHMDAATFRVLDQMELPFAVGFEVESLQLAGERLLEAASRASTMGDAEARALAHACERLGAVIRHTRSAATGVLARLEASA